MSLGVPVVATEVGGVPDLISSSAVGSVVPSEDPSRLATALLQLLENPEKAAKLGSAGRRHVMEEFSLERMAIDTAKVYHDCLEN